MHIGSNATLKSKSPAVARPICQNDERISTFMLLALVVLVKSPGSYLTRSLAMEEHVKGGRLSLMSMSPLLASVAVYPSLT